MTIEKTNNLIKPQYKAIQGDIIAISETRDLAIAGVLTSLILKK